MHRLGAYLCVALVVGFWFAVMNSKLKFDPVFRAWTRRLNIAIWIQVALGIANVIFVIPPLITVLHLAVATYLLGAALRLSFLMKWDSGEYKKPVLVAARA